MCSRCQTKATAKCNDEIRLRPWTTADAPWYNIAVAIEDSIGDISYWIAAESRGRGVASRALALFVDWIHANLDVRELRLWTHVDNAPSRAVAERAGFVRDPERDQVRDLKGARWPTVAYRFDVDQAVDEP